MYKIRVIDSGIFLIDFSCVTDLEDFLKSKNIDPSIITSIIEYVLGYKKTSSNIYTLLLEMTDKSKSMQIVEKAKLVFHDDTEEEEDSEDVLEVLEDQDLEDQDLEDQELEYPDTYYLPILFSIDKSNNERMWKIWVVDDTVHRLQGLVKGKKQDYKRIYKGKNIGKANETSAEEQAKQSAETMWVAQIDKGYYPKCKEGKAMLARVKKATVSTGGHNINAGAAIRGRKTKTVTKKKNYTVDTVQVPIKPMKASVWELKDDSNPKSVLPKVLKYFDFEEGVYMQWKFDGWRGTVRLQLSSEGNVECVITTNNGKQFPWFVGLRGQFIEFLSGREDIALDGLDGEFYAHRIVGKDGTGLDDEARFSTISSICGVARTEPHELESQINFIVFDLVDLSGKYDQDARFELLKKLFSHKPPNTDNIHLCDTKVAYFVEEIYEYHDSAAQEGYEGIILRARDLIYSNKRSLKMRKYKHFIDREYPIVDVEKDEGVGDEYFVWVCHDPDIIDPNTKKPKRFKAKPRGSREDREYWYANYLEYLGMPLTVKFQEYSEDGVPRFPIGIGIREDQ